MPCFPYWNSKSNQNPQHYNYEMIHSSITPQSLTDKDEPSWALLQKQHKICSHTQLRSKHMNQESENLYLILAFTLLYNYGISLQCPMFPKHKSLPQINGIPQIIISWAEFKQSFGKVIFKHNFVRRCISLALARPLVPWEQSLSVSVLPLPSLAQTRKYMEAAWTDCF